MLKGRRRRKSRRSLQLTYKLPTVERVEKVDEAGFSVEHLNGKLPLLHKDARRLLVGIAAIFQFQFPRHNRFPPICFC